MSGLGRRKPPDFAHVDKYPARAVLPPVDHVERTLRLPQWHWTWDQGSEGAYVGYGSSMMMSLLNARRYDPRWLWDQAKLIDDWPETNPGDDNGTSVRAACDVLAGKPRPVSSADGIAANRGSRRPWWPTVREPDERVAAPRSPPGSRYEAMERLLARDGEACLVTDR